MQRFQALTATASLTLTAALTLQGSVFAQSGPQKVPVRPDQDSGTQLGDAAARLDRDIQLVRSGIVRGDQRPDDLESMVASAEAWVRAASADLGSEATSLVQRQIGAAGTNLLNRSADSVLTLEGLGDFQAAALDAEVERALRRLSRSAAAGATTPSEVTSAKDAWSARVDFERQRARRAADAAKPFEVQGFGGPSYTLGRQFTQKGKGIEQPDVIIDYDRGATGVGLSELEIAFQESLDHELERARGRRATGLEETFLLVTEFRFTVAKERYRRQVAAGEYAVPQKILVYHLALERQRSMARVWYLSGN